jgi:hypothetical protein
VDGTTTAPTLELLAWLEVRDRTYAETMEAWRSHCPRLMVWEDALADRLVAVQGRQVVVTTAGQDLLSSRS